LFSKYEKNQILYKIKHPSKKGTWCFILESNRPSRGWHSSSVSSSVEVDSEVTIAETSADTPLVAGAAFNFL
jgi:hypothetical protein